MLKEPFDLCSATLYEAFTKKHQLHMDYAISRINRDIRFSKDKSPYKARKWVVLKEALTTTQHWKFRPVFYFELMPEGYAYGMGVYEASPAYMWAFPAKNRCLSCDVYTIGKKKWKNTNNIYCMEIAIKE